LARETTVKKKGGGGQQKNHHNIEGMWIKNRPREQRLANVSSATARKREGRTLGKREANHRPSTFGEVKRRKKELAT